VLPAGARRFAWASLQGGNMDDAMFCHTRFSLTLFGGRKIASREGALILLEIAMTCDLHAKIEQGPISAVEHVNH
jgi:hypothetical protein